LRGARGGGEGGPLLPAGGAGGGGRERGEAAGEEAVQGLARGVADAAGVGPESHGGGVAVAAAAPGRTTRGGRPMIAAWMAYSIVVALLLGLAAAALDRAARLYGWPSRWIWFGVLVGSVVAPVVAWFAGAEPASAG